jgi:2-phosphoglycerate kinase
VNERGQPAADVFVRSDYGLPYSKGLMAQSMMATGLPAERAYELAREIEHRLGQRAETEVGVGELRELVEQVLSSAESELAVRRFRQWWRLRSLDRTLVVLLGGVTGVGKSTVATQLASRLGITRVIATDQVRQVVRAFLSSDFVPAVHHSSFDVSRALWASTRAGSDIVAGFVQQAHDIAPGIEALVERAVSEGTQIVIEGVHLLPDIPSPALREQAVTVQALLAVGDAELHRSRFEARAAMTPRASRRYLDGFQRIRVLQDHLVARARDAGITIIDEVETERALKRVIELVLERVGADDAAGAPHQAAREPGDNGIAPRAPTSNVSERERSE